MEIRMIFTIPNEIYKETNPFQIHSKIFENISTQGKGNLLQNEVENQ